MGFLTIILIIIALPVLLPLLIAASIFVLYFLVGIIAFPIVLITQVFGKKVDKKV